jgi:LPS-assembly protein
MILSARFIGLLLLAAGVLGFSVPARAETLSCPAPADPVGNSPVSLVADRLDYDWEEDLYRASGRVAVCRDDLSLTADQVYYDQKGDRYRADGAVLVQQGETRLATDQLLWQAATRDAVAAGDVVLSNPDGDLHGSSAFVNLGSQRGRVNDGRILLKANNFHLAGKEIERLGESSYQVTEGQFTTCDGETPDWQFTAGRVRVDFGRYAVARDVWFKIHDLPVFYLPYMVFPVHTERESGFLLPRFGQSERKGAILSLAWYQVIDRNLDATLYLDYLSELGVGKGLEFRYAFGSDSFGEALAYHITGFDEMPDSYALSWQHAGTLPGQVRLSADVEYVDNIEFFEEFGESADQYTRDLTVSTVMLQRNWGKLNLTGFGRYINDLEELDVDTTLQRLPEIGVTVPFYRLGDSLLYSRTEAIGTSFWRKDEVPATAQDPALESGQRLLLRQGFSLVLKAGDWFELTPEVAAYGRVYGGGGGEDSDLLPEYSATLSTRLLRVYPVTGWGGLDRLQHSVEPQITYRYVDNHDQEDLPYYDPYDRIGPVNQVTYALINRLTGRSLDVNGNRSYRELLNLRLSQSYAIEEPRNDSGTDTRPFSDLRAELQINPAPEISIGFDSWLPVYGDQRFSRITATASYAGRSGNSASVNYSYFREQAEQTPGEYVGFELATAWLAPVYAGFQQRYDLRESQSLESLLSFEYRSQCWSLFLTLRHRSSLDDRPDDNEIMVGFSLSGLGRIGGFGSKLR